MITPEQSAAVLEARGRLLGEQPSDPDLCPYCDEPVTFGETCPCLPTEPPDLDEYDRDRIDDR